MSGGNGQADLSDSLRARELKSELRIAKEVSVRLHNELEQTEDKRYKLEDENFYLKEKVRELETRAKLNEASRQKHDLVRRLCIRALTCWCSAGSFVQELISALNVNNFPR
jgi:hypothetical protein